MTKYDDEKIHPPENGPGLFEFLLVTILIVIIVLTMLSMAMPDLWPWLEQWWRSIKPDEVSRYTALYRLDMGSGEMYEYKVINAVLPDSGECPSFKMIDEMRYVVVWCRK
jgi:hypothetical protein